MLFFMKKIKHSFLIYHEMRSYSNKPECCETTETTETTTSTWIVTEIKGYYNSVLTERFRSILIFSVFLILSIVIAHNLAIAFGVLPMIDICPLICGPTLTILGLIVVDIILLFLLYIIVFFKPDYREFIHIWPTLGINQNDEYFKKKVKQIKKELSILHYSSFIIWAAIFPFLSRILFSKQKPGGLIQYSVELAHLICFSVIPVIASIQLGSLVVLSGIIKELFIRTGKQIDEISPKDWTLEKLRYHRNIYSAIIDLTEAGSHIWSNCLTFVYPLLNAVSLIILYLILSGQFSFERYYILGSIDILIFYILASINRYVIGINTEASGIYNTVYKKSLVHLGHNHLFEINLFLERIGRADVGFMFNGVFVFSPTFMTSIITVSVSIIIAFPSLLDLLK